MGTSRMPEQSIFVARERELAILNDALNRALAGQGSVVFIAGEKGTGKTRLAREFIAAALARPETIVPAAGFSNPNTGEGEPFLPWRGVMEMLASEVCKGKLPHVQALFPIPKGWGRESELHRERLRKVGKLLIRILTEVAPELASAWLGVSVPGLGLGLGFLIDRLVGEKRVATPQEWRERVFSQYPAAIARLADAFPLILFLDDFHWADNSSHGMLYHLAEMATRHRLLIVVTLRPQDREAPRLIALQQELETKRWATSFSLDLLDIIPEHRARMKEFVNQFLDRNYAPNALDERFRACLVEQTEGHAFIVEETLKQFEQEGTLRQDGSGRWVLAAEPDWSRLPRTVEGMVERRLEGVSEDDLRLLRAAAVEGAWAEEFTVQVIARVLDLGVRQVRERLDGELGRRRELVFPSRSVRVEETGQPLDLYRLRHRAFQEHLYGLLSPGERRDLHAEVTLALRELLGEAWKEEPDLLAYHARRGERWPELAKACLYLARRQRWEYDAPTATQTAQEGLAALDKVRDDTDRRQLRADLEQELGLALYYSDRYAEARPHYERAKILYDQIEDREGEANAIQALGDMHMRLDEYEEARGRYQEALEIYREIKHRLGEAHAIRALGEVHMALDEYEEARGRYQEALGIFREINDRLGEAHAILVLGDVHYLLDEYEEARGCYEEALGICREVKHRRGEARAIKALGDVHRMLGECEEARGRYQEALGIFREIKDRLGEAHAIRALGDVHMRLDEYEEARGCYEEALGICREVKDRLGEARALTASGDLSLAEKDYKAARDWFEGALRIYRDIGERHWRTYVAPRLARALLALGETEEAVQALEEGAELARGIEGWPNLRAILWLLAQIREAQKDFSAALACYDELLSLSPDVPDFLHRRASVLFDLKDYPGALADYRRLLQLNPNDAWAHNGVGNVLDRQGDFEGAIAAYSQAIAAQPDEAAFVRNRASTLIALGRLDEARADCETASRLAPDHPYTHGRWGDLHLARGEWAEAEARYRAALAQDDSPGWRFDLAIALWGLGRTDEGWAEFDAALAKADEDTRAEAARDYRRLLARHPTLPGLAEAIERLTGVK